MASLQTHCAGHEPAFGELTMIEQRLRAWHEAERKAELAELAYRTALADRRQSGSPPLALYNTARSLRANADAVLRALLDDVGSPMTATTGEASERRH